MGIVGGLDPTILTTPAASFRACLAPAMSMGGKTGENVNYRGLKSITGNCLASIILRTQSLGTHYCRTRWPTCHIMARLIDGVCSVSIGGPISYCVLYS